MDKIDHQILSDLKENARIKASDISKNINLSVSSVIERIKKMESNGTIEKYTITLNQKKMGNDVIVLIEVSLEHPKYYDNFTKTVMANNNILSCYCVAGDCDFIIKVVTKSSESLEKIHREIMSLEGVKSTKTNFVFTVVKSELSYLPE